MKKILWILAALLLACALCFTAGAEEAGSPAEIPGDTPVYRLPAGGIYYHLVPNCTLNSGVVLNYCCTWAELEKEPYSSLKPCEVCTVPMTRTGETPYATFGETQGAGSFSFHNYYGVKTAERDGAYYRVVARYDEKAQELLLAVHAPGEDGKPEWHEEIANQLVDYCSTLPVSYEEKITAIPLSPEELDAYTGEKISAALRDGFSLQYHFCAEPEQEVLCVLEKGFYTYKFVIDVTPAEYEECREGEQFNDLTVKSAEVSGLSSRATDLKYRPDGTKIPLEWAAEPAETAGE